MQIRKFPIAISRTPGQKMQNSLPQLYIVNADATFRSPKSRPDGSPIGSGDEPPHDGDMESRVRRIEEIIPNLATKTDVAAMQAGISDLRVETKVAIADLRADFHKNTNELIKWIVGTAFVGIALFITIMTFVLNNAVPKASVSVAQPTPIMIQLPAQQSASPPPTEQPRQP
jgi:hypothetical protein